jgi:uncharacterized protein YlxW (UPF0749 family)
MRPLFVLLLLILSANNLFSQTETEKKLILLEYQIKELKEQNEKLTERVIALELQLNKATTPSKVSTSNSLNSSQTKTLPKATTGGRCTAITQAGTQCKRNAQAGRSRCWQH